MYTEENIIYLYDDKRVAGLIGKEVYYSMTPYGAMMHANEDIMCDTLVSATDDGFVIEGSGVHWSFIIGKKLEYRPFNSFEEFAMHYECVFETLDYRHKCMLRGGFWLIYNDHRILVKGYTDDGIMLESDVLDWKYILDNFLMPDTTPCGIKEE